MTEFLLFSVYAPLSSWGDIAVGEARGSWDRPSRSAVLGLLGAAIGIEREDQVGHDALDAGYGVAVRVDAAGLPLTDYHTVLTVSETLVRRHKPQTRRELLSLEKVDTVLSRRDLRQDALATIVIWGAEGARWPLSDLQAALRQPRFTLSAGRKANVLGLPLDPIVVTASSLREALGSRTSVPSVLDAKRMKPLAVDEQVIAHDRCVGFESGLSERRRETRRDTQAHRARWQFKERVVQISSVPSDPPS